MTGGTGFVGKAIADRLLSGGERVRLLVRSKNKLAADFESHRDRLEIVEGDLADARAMSSLADGAAAMINCAGATHALTPADFDAVNVDGARRAAEAAAGRGARIVQISSMAARAPHLSPYARSKRLSEEAAALGAGASGRWAALRLPAVYGPGDLATLPYFRIVRAGFAPEPATTPPTRASILYVEDVAAAVVETALRPPPDGVYEVGDEKPDGHAWAEIAEALGRALSRSRPARRLRLPRPVLGSIAAAVESAGRLRGKAAMVTPGKIAEFFHPDFAARDNLFSEATDWRPATPLEQGFAKTVRWYQERGLL